MAQTGANQEEGGSMMQVDERLQVIERRVDELEQNISKLVTLQQVALEAMERMGGRLEWLSERMVGR